MMALFSNHTKVSILTFFILLVMVSWYFLSTTQSLHTSNPASQKYTSKERPTKFYRQIDSVNRDLYTKFTKFSNDVTDFSVFKKHCFNNQAPVSIEDVIKFTELLKTSTNEQCSYVNNIFQAIYKIRTKHASIVISDPFMVKVKKWLQNNVKMIEATKNQLLIFIDNLLTYESVVFNPVRSKRPGVAAGDINAYVTRIVDESRKSCDFCSYSRNTAKDEFGYMKSKYAVIISNTFKIEKYHGMILFKQHHPLKFTQDEFIDAMNLAMKWFEKTHSLTLSHLYRFMYWDILPKASTSQIHPHMHLTLGDFSYYAKWNELYHSALLFAQKYHANYWTSILQAHSALNLVYSLNTASVIAYLTPQKDYEVVIVSSKPCLDFFRLVYLTLRTFIEDLSQLSLSMGFVFPKINDKQSQNEELPMIVRIISRGPADATRSDVSSFDLFGTPNVNKDPFKLMSILRESLDRHVKEPYDRTLWEYD